jgi:hypothetical protein
MPAQTAGPAGQGGPERMGSVVETFTLSVYTTDRAGRNTLRAALEDLFEGVRP